MTKTLTLFSSPKPFTNPHIDVIQRNAIGSWVKLGEEIKVILLGDEKNVAEVASELKVTHISGVELNSSGTPLLSSLFSLARVYSESPLLAYVNADIILFADFLESAKEIFSDSKHFLAAGQRWDMDVKSPLNFTRGWQKRLLDECEINGKLHKPTGSDYFIFPRSCFIKMPDFAIGRAGWDNWMFYEARQQGWNLVDATQAIHIIHQNHDYSHLPDGQPHYHLPETYENIRLAGGRRHIFLLQDADWQFVQGKLERRKLSKKKFLRELEIFPLIRLHSEVLGNIFFAIFHPRKAYNEFRKNQSKKSELE
jgi:hypothetical protein